MKDYTVRYKNSKFSNQKIEVDGKSYNNCEFENCIIVLEKGETDLRGCKFKDCKLMLRGNAYTVGKIIKLFTGKSPLKVLDFDEPLFEKS
jgi:hypothetical protein